LRDNNGEVAFGWERGESFVDMEMRFTGEVRRLKGKKRHVSLLLL